MTTSDHRASKADSVAHHPRSADQRSAIVLAGGLRSAPERAGRKLAAFGAWLAAVRFVNGSGSYEASNVQQALDRANQERYNKRSVWFTR